MAPAPGARGTWRLRSPSRLQNTFAHESFIDELAARVKADPAAIGNAVFDATGARLREVPFTPERVMQALAR